MSGPAKAKGHQVKAIDVMLRGVCRNCTEFGTRKMRDI